LHEFTARVRLYTHWDGILRDRTRFFRAAALTNAALVELCSLRCSRLLAGRRAMELLGAVGHKLERLNIQTAAHLQAGLLHGHDLDSSLIQLEQRTLQEMLARQAARAPLQNDLAIQQLNRLLLWAERCPWPSRLWPSGWMYRGVLRRVRTDLGRRPDFALLADRVAIGTALLATLR
jgi:hypothetical protein